MEEMNRQNYDDAERLLEESIELYAAAGNKAKLAERYATLATVQSLSGKLSRAVHSLSAVRDFNRQIADRNSEVQTLIEMGKTYFQLGDTKNAVTVLEEAYLSSQLFRLTLWNASSALELGMIHAQLQRHQKAVNYFSHAAPLFLQHGDTAKAIETIIEKICSLLRLGEKTNAYENVAALEQLLLRRRNNVFTPNAYALCGFAFLRSQEWSFARTLFEHSLALYNQTGGATKEINIVHPYLGLGEVYYNNFAYDDARKAFVTAYNIAKEGGNDIVIGYLLIRIADCDVKRSARIHSQDGIIRASQFYEHAQTLFTRAGFGMGEALAIHRLGMLKELIDDDNSAITHYKRAYEKFVGNDLRPEHLSLPVEIDYLYTTSIKRYSQEEWFTERLSALLLQYGRYNEALNYIEQAHSHSLRYKIASADLRFRDPAQQKRYADFISAFRLKNQLQFELFHLLKSGNKEYANRLKQKAAQAKASLGSAISSLIQYDENFSFISTAHRTPEFFTESLSPSTTLLRYCIVANEVWVFILQQGEEIRAVKISSFGYELSKKMEKFIGELNSAEPNTSDMRRLSQELYAFFIQPVERFAHQRLVIVPPVGFEKFPFHALTKDGKPLIEMIEVSYLPSLSFARSKRTFPRFITNIIAVGFTPNTRWGLEFELRDIRSFFRNTQVYVNQSATAQRLESALGEVLQISSIYQKNSDGERSFLLSDGTTSKAGTALPISSFTSLHPFQLVYLSDVQSQSNGIDAEHSLYWMMNGSSAVVATQFPLTPKMSGIFGENFYSTLSSTTNPYSAYRQGVLQLNKQKEFSDDLRWASYFYYGL